MKIKNNTLSADSWCGQQIDPGAYYEPENFELVRWQNDSKVLQDIGSGNLIVNNGTDDVPDVASAINLLKNIDPTPRDSDGSPLSRTKVTQSGWNYQMLGFEITTSTVGGVASETTAGTSSPHFSYKMFDVNGAETEEETECVLTQVDFEPAFDYEIMGGELRVTAPSSEDIILHVVGVPDIPQQYGGSKPFVENLNLKYVNSALPVSTDGRAPKRLAYSSTLHTNKLRFIFKHSAGTKFSIFQLIELFRP